MWVKWRISTIREPGAPTAARRLQSTGAISTPPNCFHAGWVRLADHTGPTTARPTIDEYGNAIAPGFRYLYTTLGRVVVSAGGQWIDASTGVAS